VIRRSRGKPRPELPRRAELRAVDAEPKDPREGRSHDGRFVVGNQVASDRGWRTAATRLLGHDVADPVMRRVSEDMRRLHGAVLRELPASESVLVRTTAAQWAQVSAIASFWGAVAIDKGLASPEGIEAAERSRIFGQRSERLGVTLTDLAGALSSVAERGRSSRAQSAVLAQAVRRLEASRKQAWDPDADEQASPSAQDAPGGPDDEQTPQTTQEDEETP
jgi:hypothetical protein